MMFTEGNPAELHGDGETEIVTGKTGGVYTRRNTITPLAKTMEMGRHRLNEETDSGEVHSREKRGLGAYIQRCLRKQLKSRRKPHFRHCRMMCY